MWDLNYCPREETQIALLCLPLVLALFPSLAVDWLIKAFPFRKTVQKPVNELRRRIFFVG
jgi:hypothetical protein